MSEDNSDFPKRGIIDQRKMPVYKFMPRPDGLPLNDGEDLLSVEQVVGKYLLSQLDNLIQAYVEQEAIYYEGETGYSPVEGQKIRIADWVLDFLGIKPEFDHDADKPVHELVIRPRKKAKISVELRYEVWGRDNFTCKHCGSRHDLAIDHIIAESKGGPTTLENLQTLCRPCNSRKGTK